MERFDPGRQPSGRTPAPGRLGLVQAFANSFWDLDGGGADEWADAAGYGRWLAARGFGGGERVSEDDRVRAIELREALRRIALGHHDGVAPEASDMVVLNTAARSAPLALRFEPDGSAIHVPSGDGPDAALALVLGVVAEAQADGRWSRVKACPGPHCGWLFYDASRNRSRQWCSMEICGNRVKGREFRARRRGAQEVA
ncbi:CGNR zinc finger domain-containing protein [Conexibacter woesei]|uniref:CGNR zinc finger domain-containing protein n=1 Tax=Conexibacter woesei TaxID=191495 RepID=UPI0004027E8C|nr:CGNR zinc finger domain-containing protein [Conexibacter woesei]